MYKVKKRTGQIVDFDIQKISNAIQKAFDACEKQSHPSVIDMIALRVASDFEPKIKDDIITIEDIQDSVEKVLSEAGYADVAKAYILYRKQREKLRAINQTTLNYKDVVDNYLGINDWRVKENSSVTYSIGGLILSNSGAVTANYWLSEVYDEEIAKAHKNCDFHIHDLSMLAGYCAGWNLKQLIQEGISGVPGKITSAPASHLSTLCNQMVNFLGIMQNEWAGAQAFSSFDTYLAPFVKVDNLTYKQVKQCIQSFVFGVNTPSRWGCVPMTTKILTADGWKSYDELKVGDKIYTWVDGIVKEAPLKHLIHHKNDFGVLHQYKGLNYVQTVTPEHRCLVESGAKRGVYLIKQSMDIFHQRNDIRMPANIKDIYLNDIDDSFTDEEIILAAMYYADGTSDFDNMEISKSANRDTGLIKKILDNLGLQHSVYNYQKDGKRNLNRYHIAAQHKEYMHALIGDKYGINPKFLHLSKAQSKLFIHTWASFDGNISGRIACQYDNDEIADALEIIALRAGYLSHKWSRKKASDKNPTNYVYIDTRQSVTIVEQNEISYDGDVWCPNTDDGTAIFKDADGNVFISGNCQAPFSNITLDWTVPEDLKFVPAIVGGKEMDFTYGDCKAEMDMVNKAFIEIMLEGDANGRGFAYPIPTYSITRDFDWSDTENNRLLFEMTAKYGIPYFSNYINSDMEPSDIRSMCCRLRLDLRELRKKSGGFFGSGENTGSVGVVTINMPRLAYLSADKDDFYNRLDKLMDLAARSLKTKRDVIEKLLEAGLYPYSKRYLGTFNNHFSTIGLVGMNEAGLNAKWLKHDMTHKDTQDFAVEVLNHMRERLSDYQELYGDLYNLEATPAESTAYRFAKHDKEEFPDIITAAGDCETPYYTNSSHLPVGYTEDVFSALDIQDKLQTLYTSGTVFHAFLGEKLPDWKAAANLVRKIAENYKLPYFTMSPTYSVCQEHGYIKGEVAKCPVCGKPTEIYSRITGYYRPVQNWNDGKTQEFKDRLTYNISRFSAPHPAVVKNEAGCDENGCAIQINLPEAGQEKLILFANVTCPNCKAVEARFDKANMVYTKIIANDNPELVEKYHIQSTPTLIIEGDTIQRYAGPSKIFEYMSKRQ